ncbi:MAG: endo alpha-1,4 polygalactosaminidase [Verrucomicrobiales bacterium]
MKWFSPYLAAALVLAGLSPVHGIDSFYVDYAEDPPPDLLLAHDLSILDLFTHADLAPGKRLGNRFLAYLSLVEIAPDAAYREEVAALGIPEIGENEAWRSTIVDIADPRWKEFFVDSLAARAVERGFDGFYLDTADSVELIAAKYPERSAEFSDALVELVTSLRRRYPKAEIVLNRGFPHFSSLKDQIDGILIESVFETFNPADGTFRPVAAADTEFLCAQIAKYKKAGIDAYVLDYVDPDDATTAIRTENKIRDIGAIPFLSTYDLEGTTSGGRVHIPRKILVLYGSSRTGAGTRAPGRISQPATSCCKPPWSGWDTNWIFTMPPTAFRTEPRPRTMRALSSINPSGFRSSMKRPLRSGCWSVLGRERSCSFSEPTAYPDLVRRSILARWGSDLAIAEFPAREVEITHLDEEYLDGETAVRPIRWGFVGAAHRSRARRSSPGQAGRCGRVGPCPV